MKKLATVISLLLTVVLLFGAVGAFAASADEPTFKTKDITAYIFSLESTKTITCCFSDDLPDVPFIDPVDYLNVIYTDTFTEEKNEDGTYTVTNAYGATMVIDPANGTISCADFDAFGDCSINEEGSSIEINYVNFVDGYYTVEASEITLDLAAYDIPVPEIDGKVYLPLTIIAPMFSLTYNNALYFEDSICFVHTFDPESYFDALDQSSLYAETTRSAAMAQFTYNTLCFCFDYFYGKPSNTYLAEFIKEMKLDEALDACDEYTQFAKQLLLSENKSEYFSGLCILGLYLYDGGHTVLPNIPIIAVNFYTDQPLSDLWYGDIQDYTDTADAVWVCLDILFDEYGIADGIAGIRESVYEQYEDEIVKDWESGTYMIVHGNTAVFVFDSFEIDTPNELKEALDLAKELGVKNFIIDDSCNGGGYVAACNYICAIISNARYKTNTIYNASKNPLTGSVAEYYYEIDLNLDGVFDDLDKEVFYDFNFAVLTSYGAFSSGNALPVIAQSRGILILGEASGGGSCIVSERYTADGYAYPVSDLSKSVLPGNSNVDFDLGAQPDFELVYIDEEGNYVYDEMYDIDTLATLVERYYEANPYVDSGINPLPIVILIASLILCAAIVIYRKRALRFPEK